MPNGNFFASNPNAPERVVVGGLTPLTTIDYPDQLAAVVFLQGCPWRCGYCHNADLIPTRSTTTLPWNDVLEFLNRRRRLLDAVVFSGGEPTLHAGLEAAIRQVKALGFKIGLHSAGIYPHRIEKVLPLIDWVGLDIKSARADYKRITGAENAAKRAWQSLALVLDSGIDYETRTTIHPDLLDRPQITHLLRQLRAARVRNVVLQECVAARCRETALQRNLKPFPDNEFFARFRPWFERFEVRHRISD